MKTLTAFCDLKFCPVSYDFVIWLVRAMVERDARHCVGLHVVLVPHEEGLGGFSRHWGEHDEAAARWRLWHIVMASIPLAGATVTLAASRSVALDLRHGGDCCWWPEGRAHLSGPLIADWRAGKHFSARLRATDAARRYVARWFEGDPRPVLTLTTRHQTTDPTRNSNLEAWQRFYEWPALSKYRIVRLQDTNDALAEHEGTWSELDPDLRLALYERAKMNCIGSNGPCALLWFSGAPLLQFGFGEPAAKWHPHLAEHYGFQPGDQPPWFGPDQRLVWRPDCIEVMHEEFQRWATATS